MNKSKWLLLASIISFGHAQAMEGVFDRSAEVDQYIEQINNTRLQEEMIKVAKPIYISGISDEKLAKALGERLIQDLPSLKDTRTSSQYGEWMVKALGSTGTDYARTVITQAKKLTKVSGIIEECDKVLADIDWQRHKDEIMASRANYQEGDNMRVAQLMNLLKDSDFTYKREAAYRMSWDKILDARLMDEIANQLQTFLDTKQGSSKDETEVDAMCHYVRILGYSGNKKYRPLLVALYNAKSSAALKKHLQKAVHRLDEG